MSHGDSQAFFSRYHFAVIGALRGYMGTELFQEPLVDVRWHTQDQTEFVHIPKL